MTATNLSATGVLTYLVVTFLTPMFLATTGGDLDQAHAAAMATVRACTVRNPIDIFLNGQMIALGLATLSSVSLSMADDLSINQILRLRGNAVSLQRASERLRRALPEQIATSRDAPLTGKELAAEKEVIAEVMRTRQRVAEYKASFTQSQPAPPPQSATPRQAPPQADPDFPPRSPDSIDTMKEAMAHILAESDRRVRAVAPQVVDDRASPPATETRVAALGTTANQLIGATAPPRR